MSVQPLLSVHAHPLPDGLSLQYILARAVASFISSGKECFTRHLTVCVSVNSLRKNC